MTIRRLNDNVIFVILNDKDLENRSIKQGELKKNTPEYRKLISDVMEHAQAELGLESIGCQIMIETCRHKQGEYTLTISKIDSIPPLEEILEEVGDCYEPCDEEEVRPLVEKVKETLNRAVLAEEMKNHEKEQILRANPRKESLVNKPVPPEPLGKINEYYKALFEADPEDHIADRFDVLFFRSFDKLLQLLRYNKKASVCPSQLYEYQGGYYLVLSVTKKTLTHLNDLELHISEFGGVYVNSSIFVPLLEEYGNKIIKRGAIARLLKHFED